MCHGIVQLLYTKIYWCPEVVLELGHRKYRPRKHFAYVEISFYRNVLKGLGLILSRECGFLLLRYLMTFLTQ